MKESTHFRVDRRGNSRRIATAVVVLAINCLLTSLAFGQVSVSSGQIQFADQPVNTTSETQTITVTNYNSAPSYVRTILLSGIDATSFSATNGCFNTELPSGASCSIGLSFEPLRAGSIQATLLIAQGVAVALSGTATGTTPTYALPHYQVTIVDNNLPGLEIMFPPRGFNNHDEFVGSALYSSNTFCDFFADFSSASAFVFSGGSYTDLRNVVTPGSSCAASEAIGIDDASEVFGWAEGVAGTLNIFRYAQGTRTVILQDYTGSTKSVTSNGIVLLPQIDGTTDYWFDGQLIQPQLPPFCPECRVVFDARTRSWVNLGGPNFIGAITDVNLGGFAAGGLDSGPGQATACLFKDGVVRDTGLFGDAPAAHAGFNSVNAAGQAIAVGPGGQGLYYWSLRTGLQPLEPLLPPGWMSVTTSPVGGGIWLPFINDVGHILTFAIDPNGVRHLVILTPIVTMPTANNVVAESGSTTLSFTTVNSPGTTTIAPIDASTTGTVPGGFAISDTVAYQISTTATFTGSVTVSFVVPGLMSEAEFNNLRVLHNVNGSLVDITTGYDYSRMTIYATTTSFSPFYLARRGTHIAPLFDTTKAYKAGSTVPIKLQVLDSANANVSSAALMLKARKLIRLQDSTQTSVIDSGNSNPDSDFRFDSTIGGSGGYIYNLSTKNLNSGRYSLSMNVGSDKGFVYSVSFEVR